MQGADFKNNQTTKQQNKYRTKNIIVFLLNNFIWTNRKGETILYLLIISPNKIVCTNRKVETKLYLLPIGPDIIVYLLKSALRIRMNLKT